MPKYTVTWVVHGNYSVDVEAATPDFAVMVASEEHKGSFGDLRNVDYTDLYVEEVIDATQS